jgi:hypothetical protein
MSLIARLFSLPDPPHHLIAPSPRLEFLRSTQAAFLLLIAWVFLTLCAIDAFNVVNAMITSEPIAFSMIINPSAFPISIFLGNAVLHHILLLYWKRIESKRFAAVQEGNCPLAEELSWPGADVLQPPLMIKTSLMQDRKLVGLAMGLMTLLCIIYIYIMCLNLPIHLPFYRLWSLLIAIILGSIIFGSFLLIYRRTRTVEIGPEGITFQITSKDFGTILWQEARLFACYPEPGPWRSSPVMVYELSSAKHVFHWTYVQRKSNLSSFIGLSEEDNKYAGALCSLVAEQTGLPLYDLSKNQS